MDHLHKYTIKYEHQQQKRKIKIKAKAIKMLWTANEEMKLFEWINEGGPESLLENKNRSHRKKHCHIKEKSSENELKKRKCTKQEDSLIFSLCRKYGPDWNKIVKSMPERTKEAIRNQFFFVRKLLRLIKKKNIEESHLNLGNESHDMEPDIKSEHFDTANIQIKILKEEEFDIQNGLKFENDNSFEREEDEKLISCSDGTLNTGLASPRGGKFLSNVILKTMDILF